MLKSEYDGVKFQLNLRDMWKVFHQSSFAQNRPIEAQDSPASDCMLTVMLLLNREDKPIGWGYSDVSTFWDVFKVSSRNWYQMMLWANNSQVTIFSDNGNFVITKDNGEKFLVPYQE